MFYVALWLFMFFGYGALIFGLGYAQAFREKRAKTARPVAAPAPERLEPAAALA